MRHVQDSKRVIMVPPELKNNGAFTTNNYVDVAGWNHLRVEFVVGATDADVGSGDAVTPPLVEECDTVGGAYTAVADAELAAVIGAGDDNKAFAIDVDLKGSHKRYMRVKAPTADNQATGCNLTIIGLLTEGQTTPLNAAGQGLEELVQA